MDPAEQGPALSFVVPVYNEEGNVGPLHAELTEVARATGRTYELVFVNDGSRDRTLERLIEIAENDPHLRVVELDGNFGEASALSAGLRPPRARSSSRWTATARTIRTTRRSCSRGSTKGSTP